MTARRLAIPTLVLALLAALALVLAPRAAGAQAPAKPTGKVCKDNGECDRSQYCALRSGKCAGPGNCTVRPQVCPDVFDPVCGCDGVTYSNSCFAAMAGANVRSAGACAADCSTNADCKKEQFCSKATGDCDGRGRCTRRPEACIQIFDPVCGCDNKTHGNACTAASAGVSVRSLGECGGAG